MAAFKIALCVVVLVSFVNAEDVSLRSVTEIVIEKPLVAPKETRATVIGSNLSANDAIKIANDVQAIYDSIKGAKERAVEIQNYLKQQFPTVPYNNVFVNFEEATFYQIYYVHVYVNGENVVGFGYY